MILRIAEVTLHQIFLFWMNRVIDLDKQLDTEKLVVMALIMPSAVVNLEIG